MQPVPLARRKSDQDAYDHDQRPRQARRKEDHVRHRKRRPATLHDLLVPRVVEDVPEPVRDEDPEVHRNGRPQPPRHSRECAREQERREHEHRPVQPVVVTVVDGVVEPRLPEWRPPYVHLPEREPEIGGQPRQRDHEQDGSDHDPPAVAT